jgi:hypothetical protein
MRLWTESEIAFLKDNFSKLKDEEIAQKLGRTKAAVQLKRKNLHLHKGWGWRKPKEAPISREELYDLYYNKHLSCVQIAELKGVSDTTIRKYRDIYKIPSRGYFTCRRKYVYVKNRGPRPLWSPEEIAILKEKYASTPMPILQKLLPLRNPRDIMNKASSLRLRRDKSVHYAGKEPKAGYENLTPPKAYLLGVLCGDGYLSRRGYVVGLKCKSQDEKDFIAAFNEALNAVYGLKTYVHHYGPSTVDFKDKKYTSSPQTCIRIYSKKAYMDLIRYDPTKKGFKREYWRVPREIIKTWDEALISSFLRGFYDSEGSTVTENVNSECRATIYNTCLEGLIEVHYLIMKLGFQGHILFTDRETYSKGRLFYIQLYGNEAVNFLNLIKPNIRRKSFNG